MAYISFLPLPLSLSPLSLSLPLPLPPLLPLVNSHSILLFPLQICLSTLRSSSSQSTTLQSLNKYPLSHSLSPTPTLSPTPSLSHTPHSPPSSIIPQFHPNSLLFSASIPRMSRRMTSSSPNSAFSRECGNECRKSGGTSLLDGRLSRRERTGRLHAQALLGIRCCGLFFPSVRAEQL